MRMLRLETPDGDEFAVNPARVVLVYTPDPGAALERSGDVESKAPRADRRTRIKLDDRAGSIVVGGDVESVCDAWDEAMDTGDADETLPEPRVFFEALRSEVKRLRQAGEDFAVAFNVCSGEPETRPADLRAAYHRFVEAIRKNT